MGFGLVNKWVKERVVSKMGWLDFFFLAKESGQHRGGYTGLPLRSGRWGTCGRMAVSK